MISFTQGDTALLTLTATDGSGNPIDLTGATFTTQIKGPNGIIVSFPNSQHTILNQTTNLGQFTLALSTLNTAACGLGSNKEILTQIVQGASTIFYHGGAILAVLPPVPLQ